MEKTDKKTYRIKQGYDIQLRGEATKELTRWMSNRFLFRPSDFRWMTPKLLVNVGDKVEVGTPLFADKKNEKIVVVSSVKGTVTTVARGEKRAIDYVEVLSENETDSRQVEISQSINNENVREILTQYGLWPFLRQRPFSTVPNPTDKPKAIFVSCFDSAPLAPDFNFLLKEKEEDFLKGVDVLKILAPVVICMKKNANNSLFESLVDVDKYWFDGPHPAGNVGTQIHKISPIDKEDVVWYIHPQNIAIIGHLFRTGELSFLKRIAFTGPAAARPQYYEMISGADCSSLFEQQLQQGALIRKISGNVLTGRKLDEVQTVGFYDTQITVVNEGGQREFIGWLLPGLNKWSLSHTFLAFLMKKRKFEHTTSLHGGHRNFVMTDVYEKVFPFDIIPLSLLKACLIGDVEQMENLGIYEVDDEDFALCEVVCPAKMECQKIIREGLYKVKNS